jgi:hypothetical protein
MQAIWKDLIYQGLSVDGAATHTTYIALHMHNIIAKLYHRYHCSCSNSLVQSYDNRDIKEYVKIIWSKANQNTHIIVCTQTHWSKPNKSVGITVHIHTRWTKTNDSIDIAVNIQTYWTETHGRTHTKVYIQTRWSIGSENTDVRVRVQSHCSKASDTVDTTVHIHNLIPKQMTLRVVLHCEDYDMFVIHYR